MAVIRASDITPEPIRWLWSGWLARGKLHVLAGAAGTGKTTLAISIAAAVTTGGRWPDGGRVEAGSVLIWSGEDDPKDTLVPRLLAAKGDPQKAFFISTVTGEDGERSFDPARDVGLLEERIQQIGNVRLLIVDPIVNAVAGDSHKNGEVRRALAPLVALAQKYDIAVLGISHFSKGTAGREPLERVTGSLAFGALARIVLVAAKAKQDDDSTAAQRLFARAKSNIGPDHGGFAYQVEFGPLSSDPLIETSWVAWGSPVDGSARDLLAELEPENEDGTALGDAEEFLRDLLERDGPSAVKDIQRAAKTDGHAWTTVRRAKDRLGVRAIKSGMSGGWRWELPGEGAHRISKVFNAEGRAPSSPDEHLPPVLAGEDGWTPVA